MSGAVETSCISWTGKRGINRDRGGGKSLDSLRIVPLIPERAMRFSRYVCQRTDSTAEGI